MDVWMLFADGGLCGVSKSEEHISNLCDRYDSTHETHISYYDIDLTRSDEELSDIVLTLWNGMKYSCLDIKKDLLGI